jgi:hypothetical protein
VIDGPADAVAIFRVGNVNFKISNGNILVGDDGIGLNSVLFFSQKNDNSTHFDFSNTVLNGVAFWDLSMLGSEISVDNGQGCTQLVGDKIGLQNVRFGRCAFGVAEPEGGSLLGLALAALLAPRVARRLRGDATRRG